MLEWKNAESGYNIMENLLNLQSITRGQNMYIHKKLHAPAYE